MLCQPLAPRTSSVLLSETRPSVWSSPLTQWAAFKATQAGNPWAKAPRLCCLSSWTQFMSMGWPSLPPPWTHALVPWGLHQGRFCVHVLVPYVSPRDTFLLHSLSLLSPTIFSPQAALTLEQVLLPAPVCSGPALHSSAHPHLAPALVKCQGLLYIGWLFLPPSSPHLLICLLLRQPCPHHLLRQWSLKHQSDAFTPPEVFQQFFLAVKVVYTQPLPPFNRTSFPQCTASLAELFAVHQSYCLPQPPSSTRQRKLCLLLFFCLPGSHSLSSFSGK